MRGKTTIVYSGDGPVATASMRPPQNAGENPILAASRSNAGGASMRPPQNAGENRTARASRRRPRCRFNEAPAECGGKPGRT